MNLVKTSRFTKLIRFSDPNSEISRKSFRVKPDV